MDQTKLTRTVRDTQGILAVGLNLVVRVLNRSRCDKAPKFRSCHGEEAACKTQDYQFGNRKLCARGDEPELSYPRDDVAAVVEASFGLFEFAVSLLTETAGQPRSRSEFESRISVARHKPLQNHLRVRSGEGS